MRICITGCAGFVGSNLARRLIKDGHEVVGLDNFSHGLKSNIEGLDMEFYERDLTDSEALTDLKFDVCVHLASEKIPRYSDAFFTLENNHEMLSTVIYACLHNDAKLLFASTSDVYGRNPNAPFKETDALVLGPTTVKRWSYAASKIHAEHYIQACAAHYNLKYVIMRFFSAYGPYQSPGWWGGVQSAFIDNIAAGKAIDIHGEGHQSRCFIYIDDLIDGIIAAINAENDIFNIGNPTADITIYGLAKLLFQLFDRIVPVNYLPYSSLGNYEDANVKIPDVSKARDMLGFDPKVSLYDGLKRTVEWKLRL